MTFSCCKINKFSLFAKNTLLLTDIKHTFWAIEASHWEIYSKRSLFWACCEIIIWRNFKKIKFIPVLRWVSIEPIFYIEIRFKNMFIEINISWRFLILNFSSWDITILLINSVVNYCHIIKLILNLVINLKLLILNIWTIRAFIKKLLAFIDKVVNLMNFSKHIRLYNFR